MTTVAELTQRLHEEQISCALHLYPEYASIGNPAEWQLRMERKNSAGNASITLRGAKLEELLERGLETITGVALRGAPQLTGPKADAPAVHVDPNDDIPF